MSSENTEVFTEDKMNAFAVTLFCRPDHIVSFAYTRKTNKKCLWLRRDHNYFLHVQTETPREEGTELWCDTEEFLNMDIKQILVRSTRVGWAFPVSKKPPEFMARCQWWDKYGWLHPQPLASCCWLNLFNQKHTLYPRAVKPEIWEGVA